MAVCEAPAASVQASETLSPDSWAWTAAVRADASATGVPSSAVMVSPATRPADSAALPSTVPAMGTPVVAAPVAVCEICAPRNAGSPIWIVSLPFPATICLAMLSASSIGMA